jgi:hypothetical protein
MDKRLKYFLLIIISLAFIGAAFQFLSKLINHNRLVDNTELLVNSSSAAEVQRQFRDALESADAITVRIQQSPTHTGREVHSEKVRLTDRVFLSELASDFSVIRFSKRKIDRKEIGFRVETIEYSPLVPRYLIVDVEGDHPIRFRQAYFELWIDGADEVLWLEVNKPFYLHLYKRLNLQEQ